MKRYRRIKALLGVILLAIISLLPANKVFAKPQLDFDSAVSYGYNQPLLVGDSAPFTIKITNNNTSNFEGFLQVIVPGYSNNNTLYEEKITLGPNETKSVNMVIGIPVNTDFINIRMANKKGKVVWSELTKIVCAHTKTDIRVGVLTDDFSALSYIDRTHFLSDDTKYLSLIELNLDTFPTDYYALESFDCILITDFPTDLLTKEQIDALRLWIQKGGFLIIGTGSTASKTLSGLKGTITNVNVSSTVNRSTTLGLENADYSYINLISSSSTNNGYYQAEFFYYDNYYYKPNDYAFEPWDDDDGDGYNDYVGAFGGDYDYNGDYYDAYGQYVAPEYEYLFADDAFYQDSNGAYHYKYYDERYGRVDEDNDEYKDLLKEYSQYDLIDTQGYNEYCNLWGFDPRWFIYEYLGIQDMDEIDDMFDQLFGSDYEEYTKHFMYDFYMYSYYGKDVRPDLSKESLNHSYSGYDKIAVDCAQIDISDSTSKELIVFGDTANEDYVLARVSDSGEGKIAVCAVDFTKNPLPKTDYSNEFVRNLIEMVYGAELIAKCNEYENSVGSSYHYYSGNYALRSLLQGVASAPVPPIIFYVGILFLYFVAILVLFLVFSKKGKTQMLWKIYPITAIAVAVIFFCLGFSTRVLRLNINAVTLIFPDEYVTKETNYVSAVVPKAKEYVVDFSEDVEVDRNFFGSMDYGYFYSSETDYDTYSIAFRSDYDHFQSVISNKIALDKQEFKAEAAYNTQGGIDVAFQTDPIIGGTGANNIKVTNNYSTVLEDVMIQVYDTQDGYMEYYFKKIAPNDSVVASAGKHYEPSNYMSTYSYSSYYKTNYLNKGFQDANVGKIVMGFLFGDLNKSFSKYVRRSNVIEYCEDEYEPDVNHVLVVAFPKTDICADLVVGKKYKVNRTEAIILYKDFSELEVDNK